MSAHYAGWAFSTGEEFDASWNRGAPLDFRSRRPGHPGLGPGHRRYEGRRPPQAHHPPHLGYGDRGAGAAIAPGETLIFVVDLVDVR